MYKAILVSAFLVSVVTFTVTAAENTNANDEKDIAADLALLQGSWELLHGNEGKGKPNTRSVKTIEGNKETLRRYDSRTGELRNEWTVEFKLTKSGNVRVFTFYEVGGSSKDGLSYVYKVDKKSFYDVPGLLHGDEYRNYQTTTKIWHWKRVAKDTATLPAEDKEAELNPFE